ncbi:MAG: hypothetical protein IJ247_01285 [Bacilli bacterium]|nr:hypothetical protein [Bacilli bacterium]
MANKRNVYCFALTLASLFAIAGCEKQNEETIDIEIKDEMYEQNYVYMWHLDGLRGIENRLCFQSKNYEMVVDSLSGKLIKADVNKEKANKSFDLNIHDISMDFFAKIDGSYYPLTEPGTNGRIVDSGRYINRWNTVDLKVAGKGNSYNIKCEYVAAQDYVAINHYMYTELAGSYDFKLSLDFACYSLTPLNDSRGIKAIDNEGNGFVIIKQDKNDEKTTFSFTGTKVDVEYSGIDVPTKLFTGKGVFLIPITANDDSLVKSFISSEEAIISAKDDTSGTLDVRYSSLDGVHYVDTNPLYYESQSTASGRTTYENISFSIENQNDDEIHPNICFFKTKATSITGMSPTITDESYNPTGEDVQISKNWHIFSSTPGDRNYIDSDYLRDSEGPWYHGYVSFDVEENSAISRRYRLAYGAWGETYAASHAQLSLIGWGGNQIWDQSAIGSWGESITYDPDLCNGRSFINDVRPFMVKDSTGGNNEFDWSGNVGGADFLKYIEDKEQSIINQRITYISQAPNVTDVIYSGVTENGKIRTSIRSNLGRTNDIVRNFYTIEYVFLEEANIGSLSLFELASPGYMDNRYSYFAYGDRSGIIKTDTHSTNYEGEVMDAKGEEFWFGSFDSKSNEEQGNTMFIVRNFDGVINGKRYSKPAYSLKTYTSKSYVQNICSLMLPVGAGKKIEKGSSIQMTIEFDIVPNSLSSYYGDADYLKNGEELNSASSLFNQVAYGHLDVDTQKGKLISSYPVKIETENDEAIFSMNGGLGYVPLVFTNLSNYKDYVLEMETDSGYVLIDQSVNNKDFYQVHYDASSKTYTLSFNVPNTFDMEFNETHTYRLAKRRG